MATSAGLDPEDWAAWHALTGMRSAVDRALEQRLQQDAGVSVADFDVLHGLTLAEGHRLRAGALAEALVWERSRISHQVRRMADRDLVERAECQADGRGTWVVLAPAGADAFAAGSCGYIEVLREALFDRLSDEEKRAMRAIAARVSGSAPDPAPQAVAAR